MPDQPAKASLFVDHEGKRIYFCCNKCPEKFKRDPQKYLASLSPTFNSSPALIKPTGSAVGGLSSPMWQLAGRLHVVVVHFPIALILLAGMMELTRFRKPRMSDAAYLCLMLGALAAVVAAALGWIDAANLYTTESAPKAL